VQLLAAAEAPVRAVARSVAKASALPGVVRCAADLGDARALPAVLAGTARLFLLTDNQAGFAKLQIEIVRAAEALGVGHVVKLSALGASHHSKSWIGIEHREVEDALERTSLRWTILRPHAFMQNWLGDVAESVRTGGVIESPIGEGRVPFIDARDIAAVAAAILLHPEGHEGRRYVLTGGEAVGFGDVAAALAKATGRDVVYRPITMEEARARLERKGVAREQIDAQLAIAVYQRDGGPTAIVSEDVPKILGRPPRTIDDFAADYRDVFRG